MTTNRLAKFYIIDTSLRSILYNFCNFHNNLIQFLDGQFLGDLNMQFFTFFVKLPWLFFITHICQVLGGQLHRLQGSFDHSLSNSLVNLPLCYLSHLLCFPPKLAFLCIEARSEKCAV